MPDRMRFGTALSQFRCNGRPEMIHPASDCFVRNCNSALGEQILDVTKAKREPEIEPDRLVNDLRREPISGVADFRHALWLPSRRRRDNAVRASEPLAKKVGVGRHPGRRVKADALSRHARHDERDAPPVRGHPAGVSCPVRQGHVTLVALPTVESPSVHSRGSNEKRSTEIRRLGKSPCL